MPSNKSRTRMAILEAFNELIAQKKFQQISVPDICEVAGVSKATFYRYYKDKYDVMNENYRILLIDCINREHVHSYRDLYKELCVEAEQEKWKYIRKSFDSEGYNSFLQFIIDYSIAAAEAIVRQNRDGRGLTKAERLQTRVFSYGVGQVCKDWLFDMYDLDFDTTADSLFEMMPKNLRNYWRLRPLTQEELEL